MENHRDIYTVGMGNLDDNPIWTKGHGGRFIDLGSSVSFRQAYILTSIMNCLVSPETGVFCFAQAYPQTPKILLATHTDGTHICCGDENRILASEADCAPCYRIISNCKTEPGDIHSLCAGRIPPEKVIAAIEEVYRSWQTK